MQTNVEKGELAYIVAPAAPEARGKYVTVTRRAVGDPVLDGADFGRTGTRAVWVVRGHAVPWGGVLQNVFAISDACLRPLRDPGDDAVDEVVARLGAPRERLAA